MKAIKAPILSLLLEPLQPRTRRLKASQAPEAASGRSSSNFVMATEGAEAYIIVPEYMQNLIFRL